MSPLALVPSSEADQIAAEHIVWCVSHGMAPADVIRAIDANWNGLIGPTWRDVQRAVATKWEAMQARKAQAERIAA